MRRLVRLGETPADDLPAVPLGGLHPDWCDCNDCYVEGIEPEDWPQPSTCTICHRYTEDIRFHHCEDATT